MRRKTETKIKGVLQDTHDPRSDCKIHDTGNILDSIIPVLYQSTVTCIHKVRLLGLIHEKIKGTLSPEI